MFAVFTFQVRLIDFYLLVNWSVAEKKDRRGCAGNGEDYFSTSAISMWGMPASMNSSEIVTNPNFS